MEAVKKRKSRVVNKRNPMCPNNWLLISIVGWSAIVDSVQGDYYNDFRDASIKADCISRHPGFIQTKLIINLVERNPLARSILWT